jgi:glutamine synthetase
VFSGRKVVDMFKKYKVFSKTELQSRSEIFTEQYITQVGIETREMLSIARTMILPASIEYQRRVAQTVTETESAGVDASAMRNSLESIVEKVQVLEDRINELDQEFSYGNLDPHEACMHIRDHVLDAMDGLRVVVDQLEMVVDYKLWPLPGYSQLLTLR